MAKRKIEYKQHLEHGLLMKFEGDMNWQKCEFEDLVAYKKGQENGSV